MTNVVIGAPAYLAPDWRYAGDDWLGDNALTYVVWATPPVYESDGVTVETAGVPRDLTGCTVTGVLQYQTRCGTPPPATSPLPAPTGALSSTPINGVFTLSLAKTLTGFPPQRLREWGDPDRARFIVRPKVVDADGNVVTVGLQPLFVF